MSGDLPPRVVVNIVSYAIVFNIITMAAGFAIVAGAAVVLGRGDLATIFGAGTTFLGILATLMTAFRSALVDLLAEFSGAE